LGSHLLDGGCCLVIRADAYRTLSIITMARVTPAHRLALVDGKLTTPKSGKARRVDLSAQLTDALRALLVERKREALRRGWGEMPAWVFINESGNPVDPDNFRKRVWPKILAKAGLRQIRIHDLRHTYASLLIQNGESLAYVQEQMGHHSIRVTVDTYGHLVPGGNRAAVDRLDDPTDATIRNPAATYGKAGKG
jgi:integrase